MVTSNPTVTVLLTCFNRREKTVHTVKQLLLNNATVDFIIVDDGSTDGTHEAINDLNATIEYIFGQGNYYWCGGMRVAIDAYLQRPQKSDYVLLVNDDVEFIDNCIDFLLQDGVDEKSVIVGCTSDKAGKLTYGGQRARKSLVYANNELVGPQKKNRSVDTFNANCVLLSSKAIVHAGNLDKKFVHSLGDWDYGFKLSRLGYTLKVSTDFIGICINNPQSNTWQDSSLSIFERLKKKECIKGAPFLPWFYYLLKNYNCLIAIRYSLSPYIRILFSKR